MSQAQVEIQVAAVIVAAACALPGVFLLLRRMSLLSDAISHSILLGIVLAFFAVGDLTSPLLVAGAAATGVLTVTLVEALNRTRLVHEDAAIGLVFPVLFSIAVILIARKAGSIHLDTDAVLLGELAFVPFDRLMILGRDTGPKAVWLMGSILTIGVCVILLFYKELKIATFDAALAGAVGLSPWLIHYVFMALVSVTAVGAFHAVGSILVVALMIAPPATAYLLTDRLGQMLVISVVTGCMAAIGGYWAAYALDASIAGSMAGMCGVLFGMAFLFAPQRGIVAVVRRRARQRREFAEAMLLIHLFSHEGLPEEDRENRRTHLSEHLGWDPLFAESVIRRTVASGTATTEGDRMFLTPRGRDRAREVMVDLPGLANPMPEEALQIGI